MLPQPVSFWRSVRQSLRGEEHDYTALPLNSAIILLAVPMVLEMVMESLFAVADVYWVSSLGRGAVAVVGQSPHFLLAPKRLVVPRWRWRAQAARASQTDQKTRAQLAGAQAKSVV